MKKSEYEYVKYDLELVRTFAMARFLIDICRLSKKDRENFVAIALSNNGDVIGYTTLSVGDLCGSMVHPRELMKFAILTNAAAIVVAHNHPSNNLTPSSDDITTTKRLEDASILMGIKLLDHIIVGNDETSFLSMRAKGYMEG